ncbi:hypothetical protein M408DRAFT_329220 [Serendipita vermifera MAFF 305830]|uniref:Uncharacterized protein n=1 Tax=Serendipita vermifera MAFF 305830 TaxID=933852 RepID=A0A0C2XI47_SERVB|nr:hypothetical protein M408DRAFT_329220 [Serendipita vermifera MAFF 305830]
MVFRAAALAGFNEVEQTDQNPGTRQIVKLRETRHIVATKVANSHEGAIGPINDEVKAATRGVEDSCKPFSSIPVRYKG